jgi:hypothetical protein
MLLRFVLYATCPCSLPVKHAACISQWYKNLVISIVILYIQLGSRLCKLCHFKIMSSTSDGSSDCHSTHIHRVALFFDPLSCIGSRAFYNITSNCNSKGHCQGRHWAITSQLLWNQWSLLCMISSSLVQRFFFWALFAFWKWVSTIMDFGYSLFLINKKRLHKGLACCSKEVCLILFVMIFGFETGGGSGQPATSRP